MPTVLYASDNPDYLDSSDGKIHLPKSINSLIIENALQVLIYFHFPRATMEIYTW